MAIVIPSETCNNTIILMGKVSVLTPRYGSELSSCVLKAKGKKYQAIFDRDIETSYCLNDNNIRIVGELKTDAYGDIYVFVLGYRACDKHGKYIKKQPTWWDMASWPEKWSA